MIGLELFILLILWVYIILQLLILAMLMAYKSPKALKIITGFEYPFVSILVAARNEEATIKRCILSLQALNFPQDKFEILIGNDASEDETASIVEELMNTVPNLKLIHIHEKLGSAKAKANVLAHLVHEAKAELIFVTDADIQVKPDWILTTLPHLNDAKNGIVSNATMVYGNSF
jgi:cellulose synthase/poly-beta-1,6-N-acetylglucosamine synthase-like glycosyltransferase